jgi:hypothetical protein
MKQTVYTASPESQQIHVWIWILRETDAGAGC